MAVFSFIITTQRLSSPFPSFSSAKVNGLVPWIDCVSTRANFTNTYLAKGGFLRRSRLLERKTSANLSVRDFSPSPPMRILASFSTKRTNSHRQCLNKKLRNRLELWWLLRQTLLCLTINIDDFIRDHARVRSE